MKEINLIPLSEIDPHSTINVRRSRIEEAVEKVKSSIARNGFWEHSPITLRPHPDKNGDFRYEIVAGQCRFKASLELGLDNIPAVVDDFNNDDGIKFSWSENEFSTELSPIDKSYWIQQIIRRYSDEGLAINNARVKTAEFFNISIQTVINYLPLIGLPDTAKKLLDEGKLKLSDAETIAKKTYNPKHPSESEKVMEERVNWMMGLDIEEKKAARKALSKLGSAATVEQLEVEKEKILDTEWSKVEVAVPLALHDKLIQWGEERGLFNVTEAVIIQHMITETLKGR